jgi:hypothetical protein
LYRNRIDNYIHSTRYYILDDEIKFDTRGLRNRLFVIGIVKSKRAGVLVRAKDEDLHIGITFCTILFSLFYFL